MGTHYRYLAAIVCALLLGLALWWTDGLSKSLARSRSGDARRTLLMKPVRASAHTVTIEGLVTARTDGEPVAGARIVLVREKMRNLDSLLDPPNLSEELIEDHRPIETRSDDTGSFMFAELPAGCYTVYAQSDNLAAFGWTSAGDRWLTPQLQPSGALSGHLENEDGEPIANAEIAVTPAEGNRAVPVPLESYQLFQKDTGLFLFRGQADAQGAFTFPFLVGEKWRVIAKANGYAVAQTGPIDLGVEDIHVTLTRGASAGFSVVLSGSGDAAPNVAVRLVGATIPENCWSGITDTDGQVVFTGLADDTYSLYVTDTNYTVDDSYPCFTIEDGVAPEPMEVAVLPGITIDGSVWDADSGAPIAGARVVASTSVGVRSALTGSDGVYQLAGLHAGNITVKLERVEGYQSEGASAFQTNLTISPAQETPTIDIPIRRGLMVRGRIQDTNGRPVDGVVVDWGNSLATGACYGKGGTFELTGINPNTQIWISASKRGYLQQSNYAIDVGAADIDGVTIYMDKGAAISGFVLNPAGAPLGGVKISAVTNISFENGSDSRVMSLDNGAFSIVGLKANSYRLETEGAPQALTATAAIQVALGEEVTGIRLTSSPGSGG